jgi:hypothetical protein
MRHEFYSSLPNDIDPYKLDRVAEEVYEYFVLQPDQLSLQNAMAKVALYAGTLRRSGALYAVLDALEMLHTDAMSLDQADRQRAGTLAAAMRKRLATMLGHKDHRNVDLSEADFDLSYTDGLTLDTMCEHFGFKDRSAALSFFATLYGLMIDPLDGANYSRFMQLMTRHKELSKLFRLTLKESELPDYCYLLVPATKSLVTDVLVNNQTLELTAPYLFAFEQSHGGYGIEHYIKAHQSTPYLCYGLDKHNFVKTKNKLIFVANFGLLREDIYDTLYHLSTFMRAIDPDFYFNHGFANYLIKGNLRLDSYSCMDVYVGGKRYTDTEIKTRLLKSTK